MVPVQAYQDNIRRNIEYDAQKDRCNAQGMKIKNKFIQKNTHNYVQQLMENKNGRQTSLPTKTGFSHTQVQIGYK